MSSGVERDIQCGTDFAKLYELGCFEEEFVLYGLSYIKQGKIYYLVSSNPDKIYRLVNSSMLYDIYCTPVIKKTMHQAVASGEKEDTKQKLMLTLAKELKENYGNKYFSEHNIWITKMPQDDAYDLLKNEQENLEGCFDRAYLELFGGLCYEALVKKTLTLNKYEEFSRWLRHVYKQMDNDSVEKDNFKRMFSGFAYKQNGKIKHFLDANQVNVWEKRTLLNEKGIFVTPILSKEYWFHSLGNLGEVREKFMIYLKNYINDIYIEKVRKVIGGDKNKF